MNRPICLQTLLLAAMAGIFLPAQPVRAMPLPDAPGLVGEFSTQFVQGHGIAWDPMTGHLLIANTQSQIYEFTPEGEFVTVISPQRLITGRGAGLDVLPSGNLLVVSETHEELSELTRTGEVLWTRKIGGDDHEAVVFHPGTGTMFIIEDSSYVFQRSLNVEPFFLSDLPRTPKLYGDIEGIALNANTGNLILVGSDIRDSTFPPIATLFEIATDGTIIRDIALYDTAELELPDGLTYDAASNRLFMVHSDAAVVRIFDFPPIPEPSTMVLGVPALLILAGWVAWQIYRRRQTHQTRIL